MIGKGPYHGNQNGEDQCGKHPGKTLNHGEGIRQQNSLGIPFDRVPRQLDSGQCRSWCQKDKSDGLDGDMDEHAAHFDKHGGKNSPDAKTQEVGLSDSSSSEGSDQHPCHNAGKENEQSCPDRQPPGGWGCASRDSCRGVRMVCHSRLDYLIEPSIGGCGTASCESSNL